MRGLRDQSIRRRAGAHLLIILLLVTVNVGGVWLFLDQQARDGKAIDVAGRQRMLTERLAFEAHLIGMGQVALREELAADTAAFDRSLNDLIQGNASRGIPPAPAGVREQLLEVRTLWQPFHAHLTTLLTEPPSSPAAEASVEHIEANHERLLLASDAAVQGYEHAYEAKVTRLRWFLLGVFALDLVVIPLLFGFIDRQILRPINRVATEARTVAGGDIDQAITMVDSADEVGQLSSALGEMKDQLVSALRHTRRFERAVEQAGHAIYITDPDGTIVYVNPAFEDVTGYREEEAIGANPRILQSGKQPSSYYEEMWETLESGEVWSAEIVNSRVTGELFHAFQTIAPVTDDGDIAWYVAVMADNTEQIVSRQQNQVLSRVMRHNLRTELNLIQGYVHRLTDSTEAGDQEELVAQVDDRVESLVQLSADVDRITRTIEREGPSQQELTAVTDQVVATMAQQYPEASIQVDGLGYEIDVPANIELVLEELVENAIQHNDRDAPFVAVSAELQDEIGPPPMVAIVVSDDGPGIPIAERRVIEEGEETPLFHASGLGLWTVYWTVTLAGGDVSIDERSPRGTHVRVTLPRASVTPFQNNRTTNRNNPSMNDSFHQDDADHD